jgi:SAM-dependent methyltransferase
MKFITPLITDRPGRVFLPGAGTSLVVDELLDQGCSLILNDISGEALARLKQRVGARERLLWLRHDIADPLPGNLPEVDLWLDRAVLHFLTRERDIAGYFRNLKSLLKPGGHVLLAEFSTRGAEQCAGLALHRYSLDEFRERLGPSFDLTGSEEHTYTNPAGEPRPYIYALFRRREST